MSLQRIYAIFIRQWYLNKANPIRLLSGFMWLVIDIVQWGFISRYLGSLDGGTFNFISVILGAIILWEFLSRIQQGVMTSFLEDIWSQNFINFFASPLKIGEYLAGLVASSIMTTAIGFILMLTIAGVFFGYNILKIGFMILPFLFILFVFGVSIGIFVISIIFRYGSTAEWLAWPLPFFLSIVAGVYYPISALPAWLQVISKFTPAAYVFESLRTVIHTGTASAELWLNLLIGLALSFAYLFVFYLIFIKVYRHNLKSGGIARFSSV